MRQAGDRVRVVIQLIDGETGHHLWADREDRKIHDIFALQDESTERIATTVAQELERAERQRSGSKQPSALQAWDYRLRGMPFLHEFSRDGNRQAREMFERQYLAAQIMRFGGNISRTAAFIGMERSALHRKLKGLGVSSDGQMQADSAAATPAERSMRRGWR